MEKGPVYLLYLANVSQVTLEWFDFSPAGRLIKMSC